MNRICNNYCWIIVGISVHMYTQQFIVHFIGKIFLARLNNHYITQFSSFLKAKIVQIFEQHLIMWGTWWGTWLVRDWLSMLKSQFSIIITLKTINKRWVWWRFLRQLPTKIWFWVQVKYKNFQLRVIRDTGWSTESAKVGKVVFKNSFEHISIILSGWRCVGDIWYSYLTFVGSSQI